MKKAQGSVEFMILFIIFMSALSVALYISIERTQDLSRTEVELEANKLLNDVSNKINTAFLEGDGFLINLTLPGKVFGRDYVIGVYSNYVRVEIDNVTYIKGLLTDNITGSLETGTNLVENRKGAVVIS
jgi:hypothetical protein